MYQVFPPPESAAGEGLEGLAGLAWLDPDVTAQERAATRTAARRPGRGRGKKTLMGR
jgi:hypothetical protein